jgi:hypothetical protein
MKIELDIETNTGNVPAVEASILRALLEYTETVTAVLHLSVTHESPYV